MKEYTRNTALLAAGLVLAAAIVLPGAFGADKTKKNEGKVLFEQKCLKCHKPARFKERRSDRKGWVLTLNRMQHSTCDISDQEIDALADYLASEYGE